MWFVIKVSSFEQQYQDLQDNGPSYHHALVILAYIGTLQKVQVDRDTLLCKSTTLPSLGMCVLIRLL